MCLAPRTCITVFLDAVVPSVYISTGARDACSPSRPLVVMSAIPLRSSHTSLPSRPNSTSGVSALLRRFSSPSNYTGGVASVGQPVTDPMNLINDQVQDASLYPALHPTVHRYTLKSRGRDYAEIIVRSHAHNSQDPPLLYFGEDIAGYVILSLSDLGDLQSMDVVVSLFPN